MLEDVVQHSIWLTLDPVAHRAVAALIASTADRFGCPKFEPHITLLGDLEGPVENTANLIAEIFADISATRVSASKATCGDTFFTSIILEVPLAEPFNIARSALASALTPDRHERFRPHLSLAYGVADGMAKTAYVCELHESTTLGIVTVAGVAVVRSSKTTPIDEWSTVYQLGLARA